MDEEREKDRREREELEPEKKHANRGRILAFIRSIFSLLVAEYEVTAREEVGPFCSTQNETCGIAFRKRKEKIFLK